MRRILAGISGRLAIACAFIAVVCVVITGAVMYSSARNNILQAEQERLFDSFDAMLASAADPVQCVPGECAKLSDEDLVNAVQNNVRGPGLLVLADKPGTATRIQLEGMPPSFQDSVQQSNSITWLRLRQGLSYNFLIGSRVTLSVQAGKGTQAFATPQVSPRPGDHQVIAFLYASYSMDDQQAQIDALAASTAWLLALMALVAALAGAGLGRWIARPVRTLREAVDALDVGSGGLDVDAKGVQELTSLVDAFNAASSRLQTAVAELTAKDAQSRRFVADVAHELRTPVTAMVAMADVLENGQSDPNQLRQASEVTARSARRLSRLTEDLLEISRFDAQRIAVNAEVFDVAQRLAQVFENRAPGAAVVLSMEMGLTFSTDPRRFDVVVGNLVSNAAMHGGGRVEVSVFDRGDSFVITVDDDGPGVSADAGPHLFERFYKADASRSGGGTGLGLAIVKENCRLLGGTVELTHAAHPTTFTVTLPSRSHAPAGSWTP